MSREIFLLFLALWSTVGKMNTKGSSVILNHHPCLFNALCTCSSPGPNLGSVQCISTPLASVPQLNTSKVFILHLEYNELRFLDENRFLKTDMRRLIIRHNQITRLSDDSFAGLQDSLRELHLQYNQLQFFPRRAVRILAKLKELDLTGNYILTVQKEDFLGFEHCLETLVLRENALTNIVQDTFGELYKLKSLDLSENRLLSMSQTSFTTGLAQLQHFYLSGNALKFIPYGVLARMKSLQTVDLSRNGITTTNLIDDLTSAILLKMIGGLKLEKLVLDDNFIQTLHSKSFQHFATIRLLSLNGNPLINISNDTFHGTHIEELHLRACDLTELNVKAFNGLSSTLNHIDMSHNLLNGSAIGAALIDMTSLINMSLVGNPSSQFALESLANSYHSLQHLRLESASIKSNQLGFTIDTKQIGKFRKLRTIGLSQFLKPSISIETFENFSRTIEEIVLKGSNLESLSADYFKCLLRLRNLDISCNSLTQLDGTVFKSIGRSLQTLNMGNAFHYTVTSLPANIFQYLETLEKLDMSNNHFVHLPSDTFWNLNSLVYLNLQDNALRNFQNNTLLSNKHWNLKHLKLSFNRIDRIDSNTFSELNNLRYLYLDKNAIEIIRREAFRNLDKLEHIDVEVNFIALIERDAFQNLPRLEYLNVANNRLEEFPLEIFDQVGTLSSLLKVDISHNRIRHLTANASSATIVAIKSLDFSYNGISNVDQIYFYPITSTLVKLHMRHNDLRNITRTTFGHLPQLQLLDLDGNRISTVDSDAFEQMPHLRVVIMCHNRLMNLPSQLFLKHYDLHHLDIADNELTELQDSFFHGPNQLEFLNLAHNKIFTFSLTLLIPILSRLRHLDTSHNDIEYFPNDIRHKLSNLHTLHLTRNKLKETSIDNFGNKVQVLYLSNNPIGNPLVFQDSDINQQLEYLDLSNTNLKTAPQLNFSNLYHLNLSHNDISFLSAMCFTNVKVLRQLDLSHNKMTSIPIHLWPLLSSHLTNLNLNYNPILDMKNESLLGLNVLEELNIEGIATELIQNGTLFPLNYVRTLRYSHSANPFDMVRSLSFMDNLRSIHLSFASNWSSNNLFAFRSQTHSKLPHTITSITISGQRLKGFDKGSLNYMQNRHLKLTIRNTSITNLSLAGSLGKVRQLELDVSHNALISLDDPNTTQDPDSRGVFLHNIDLQYNRLKCDCDLGWIQTWARRWRQTQCTDTRNPSTYDACRELESGLRQTKCLNAGNKSLIDVLNDDLQCGWKSSAKPTQNLELHVVFLLIVTSVIFSRYGQE